MQQRNPWGRPFYGQEPLVDNVDKPQAVPEVEPHGEIARVVIIDETVPVKKKAGRPKKKADDE